MLDITLLRRDLPGVIARLEARKTPQPFLDVERFSALEAERKRIQTRTEELQARRNALSKQIGQAKGKGEDTTALMAEVAGIADELKSGAERLEGLQADLQLMLTPKEERSEQSHDIAKRLRERLDPTARALHATIQVVDHPRQPRGIVALSPSPRDGARSGRGLPTAERRISGLFPVSEHFDIQPLWRV